MQPQVSHLACTGPPHSIAQVFVSYTVEVGCEQPLPPLPMALLKELYGGEHTSVSLLVPQAGCHVSVRICPAVLQAPATEVAGAAGALDRETAVKI